MVPKFSAFRYCSKKSAFFFSPCPPESGDIAGIASIAWKKSITSCLWSSIQRSIFGSEGAVFDTFSISIVILTNQKIMRIIPTHMRIALAEVKRKCGSFFGKSFELVADFLYNVVSDLKLKKTSKFLD